MNAPEPNRALALQQQPRGGSVDLSPQTFEQAVTLSEYMADSDMVPKQYRGRPGDCLIAIQWGAEVGLKPLQAVQSIATINGKPSLYGDAGKALLLSHGCIIEEDDIEAIKAAGKAACTITRPGRPPVRRTFSLEDAKTAGLLGKEGPWKTYQSRQMAWRAFWFAARDAAADLLRGMGGFEEAIDTPVDRHMGPVEEVKRNDPPPPATLAPYRAEDFAKNLPAWGKVVASGKKTGSTLLAMLQTKATFTEQQKAQILSLKTAAAEATPAAPAPQPEAQETPTPALVADQNDDWLAGYDAAEEGDK